jgi:hypothetical protein
MTDSAEYRVTVEGPQGRTVEIIPAVLVAGLIVGPKDPLAKAAYLASIEIQADADRE